MDRVEYFKQKFHYRRFGRYAVPVLIAALGLTFIISISTYRYVDSREQSDFVFTASDIKQELTSRLEAHASLLRSGIAFFALSDTVTRLDWKAYIARSRVERYLPDLQGIGYAKIIPAGQLEQHLQRVRQEGFPEYSVFPSFKRDIYTSIVFVEPFTGRNRRAFGYDMFTEPVRRRAMEFSRDFDVVALSGRIRLELDTGGEELYGCLMFAPYYDPDVPADSVLRRRRAIRGWLYSPYRLKTLMQGIYDFNQPDDLRVQVYDEFISDSTIMYDSHIIGSQRPSGYGTRYLSLPIVFNKNTWQLSFIQPKTFPFRTFFSFITGTIISVLLFLLFLGIANIEKRARLIRDQNEELATLNATKDKFFSIIAHDLKSPYNAVLGFSDILMTQAGRMERQEIIRVSGMIKHSANLAVDLLTNLMVWSQSQTGRMEFHPKPLDAAALINEVVDFFVDSAWQKKIELKVKRSYPGKVFGDYEMLETTLRNLVSNAIKFTNPGGTVTVSAMQQKHEVVFSVSDTGVGIPQEILPKLFRYDEGYSTSGTQKEPGTGLGLILCKEFVEKHGGRIWAESRTGKESGSTFFFAIPLVNKADINS